MRRAFVFIAVFGVLIVPSAAQAALTVGPPNGSFDGTVIGTTSAPVTFEVTSSCFPAVSPSVCLLADPATIDVSIQSIIDGEDFHQTNDCPATMPGDSIAGDSCTITVTYSPQKSEESIARLVPGTSTLPPGAQYGTLYARSVSPTVAHPAAPAPAHMRRCRKKRRNHRGKRCHRRGHGSSGG